MASRQPISAPGYARRVLTFLVLTLAASAAAGDTFEYDAQGRLKKVTLSNGTITYYCYDAAGNRAYVGPTACP